MGWFSEHGSIAVRFASYSAELRRLTEDIFAAIESSGPGTIKGPLTIKNDSGKPALTVENFGNNQTAVAVKGGQSTASGADIVTHGGTVRQQTADPADPTQVKQVTRPPVTPGIVLDGSGNRYRVQYVVVEKRTDPLTGKTKTVKTKVNTTATVPQIDPNEKVPAGTSIILVDVAGEYVFQPPVWMREV